MQIKTFCENYFGTYTNIHGAYQAANVRAWYWQLFWLILFVCGIVMFCGQSYLLIDRYLQYPKRTEIKMTSTTELVFPAVTLCNLNPFKKSAVTQSRELSEILSAFNYQQKKSVQKGALIV